MIKDRHRLHALTIASSVIWSGKTLIVFRRIILTNAAEYIEAHSVNFVSA